MIQKFIAKYGLSTHLAMLAALPFALAPFLSADALAATTLWLSAFAAVWLFMEPSLLPGEHLMLARVRVRSRMVRDPLFHLLLFLVALAAIRCFNADVALSYDAQQNAWLVSDPSFPILPSSVPGKAFLPFALAVAALVLLMGVRHGMGLGSRISFGLAAALFTGIGGAASATLVCFGDVPSVARAAAAFDAGPHAGTIFGIWLVVAVASGIAAEARRWNAARLPFVLAVAGNALGLVFFAPPYVAIAWGVAVAAAVFWSLFYLGRAGTSGSVVRSFTFMALGFAVPFFVLMTFAPDAVKEAKSLGLDPARAFTEAAAQSSDALSRIAKEMWMEHPWSGVGLGAFGIHVPFLADAADWTVIPQRPAFAQNSYWTLLAERGIVGALLVASVLGLLVWSYASRLVEAYSRLAHDDDADIFPCAVVPVVWCVLPALVLVFVEAAWLPDFSMETLFIAVAAAFSLAASSFPRRKRRSGESRQG